MDNFKYFDEELNENSISKIPKDISLQNIILPNEWVLYLYDKLLFKKIANKENFSAKPHKELYTIKTVNDLVFIIHLMNEKNDPSIKSDNNKIFKKNLDAGDFIIMRKGIEPIWEDPKNSNGGTFTVKMIHSKGYDVWSHFIMYMLGETLTLNMSDINGITVSYISEQNTLSNTGNQSFTYIKIWDSCSNRTRDQFVNLLPKDLLIKLSGEDMRYSKNNTKKDYNQTKIINKLHSNSRREKGGFSNFKKY